MFCRAGRSADEIVVTGNPAFDRINDPAVVAGAALRAARGWNDGTVTLLWASQIESARHPFIGVAGNPLLPRQIEQVLRQFIREHSGFRLVVRYHPSEREIFVEQARIDLSLSSEPLPLLLRAVDLVVVTASTVGLEAFIAGRPVISVDNSVFTEGAPYSHMGISTGVPEPEDLPLELIKAAKANRVSSGLNAASEHGRSGGADQRVLTVIETLLSDGVF